MSWNDVNDPADPLEPEGFDPELIERLLPAPERRPVMCWRCERTDIPVDGRCPHCVARLTDDEPETSRSSRARAGSSSRLPFVLFVYTLFLLTSVIWGWVILFDRGRMTLDQILEGTVVVGLVDTVLVLAALAMVGRLPLPARPGGTQVMAWMVGLPALGLLLCANVAYSTALRDYIKPPGFLTPPSQQITLFTVAVMCLQPAIVEELFFRYLALGVLTRTTGIATAVWVSAVMFAMAHIYNPLGLPYLFVAGVVFGIARVYGGLLLPMVLHFMHNLAVMWFEVMK
jgi:CAAX protease family protein